MIGPEEHFENVENIIQRKVSSSLRQLSLFLTSDVDIITEKGSPDTNIIDQHNKKTYNLKDEKLHTFFELLEKCRTDKLHIAFAEKQLEYSGIMLDFDLYQTINTRKLSQKAFHKIIHTTMTILSNTIKIDYKDSSEFIFHAFVTQKPNIVKLEMNPGDNTPQLYKEGFHILIPEIQITRETKRYLIDQLIKSNVLETAFKDIPLVKYSSNPLLKTESGISVYNNTLDKNSAHVPVMFYGNSNSNKPPYTITYFTTITMEANSPIIIEPHDPERLLSLEYFTADMTNYANNYVNLSYELSLNYNSQEMAKVSTDDNKTTKNKSKFYQWLNKRPFIHLDEISDKIIRSANTVFVNEELLLDTNDNLSIIMMDDPEAAVLKKYLNILTEEYYHSYEMWFKVLCAIANTSVRYKTLAEWFSQKSPKYDKLEFEKMWNDVVNNNEKRKTHDQIVVSKASIMQWCQQVNKEKYNQIYRETHQSKLITMAYASEGVIEHAMVAKLLHCMIGDKFLVDVDPEGKGDTLCWLEFVLPEQQQKPGELFKWRFERAAPTVIHLYLTDVIPKLYNEVEEYIKLSAEKQTVEGYVNFYKKVREEFKKSKNRLQNNGFQNGVISQAKHRFLRRGFCESLDKTPNVIGVGNGVLAFENGVARLIKSFHEYRISKYTHINYIPYNPNNPYIKSIESMAHDIYPEPDFYEWVMMYYANSLTGKCKDIFYIAHGPASCGKSTIAELIKTTLGFGYARKIPISLFTENKEKANEANSAKMILNGLLFGYASESKLGDTFNGSSVKELISAEAQSGREVYGKQKEFYNRATIYSCTNHEVKVDDPYDDGMWRRLRAYEHKVKFVDNPDPNNPNEKQLDEAFMLDYVNQVEYQEAMLSILVYYKEKLDREFNGLIRKVPSETLARDTLKYRNKQDSINRFITEKMKKIVDENEIEQNKMTVMQIVQEYKSWFLEMFSNRHNEVSDLDVIANNFAKSTLKKYYSTDPKDIKEGSSDSIMDKVIVGWKIINGENNPENKSILYDDDEDVNGSHHSHLTSPLNNSFESIFLGMNKDIKKESVKEPVKEPVKESIKEPIKEPIKETINESPNKIAPSPTKIPVNSGTVSVVNSKKNIPISVKGVRKNTKPNLNDNIK